MVLLWQHQKTKNQKPQQPKTRNPRLRLAFHLVHHRQQVLRVLFRLVHLHQRTKHPKHLLLLMLLLHQNLKQKTVVTSGSVHVARLKTLVLHAQSVSSRNQQSQHRVQQTNKTNLSKRHHHQHQAFRLVHLLLMTRKRRPPLRLVAFHLVHRSQQVLRVLFRLVHQHHHLHLRKTRRPTKVVDFLPMTLLLRQV